VAEELAFHLRDFSRFSSGFVCLKNLPQDGFFPAVSFVVCSIHTENFRKKEEKKNFIAHQRVEQRKRFSVFFIFIRPLLSHWCWRFPALHRLMGVWAVCARKSLENFSFVNSKEN
jgi:hypothetical protein